MTFELDSFISRFRKQPEAPEDVSGTRPVKVGPQLLFLELFVGLSLAITYYLLVENFAAGSPNNYTNSWVFTSCSIPDFHLDSLGDVWKGRLSGLLLSGWAFDWLVKDNTFPVDQFFKLFGLYQSCWLLLLFLAMIVSLRNALFINLGIFAGLMYNFTPASGLYFYPWDLPATLFFTLAVLFFARGQMLWMAAATCAGCFFKETVLVCALLALFAGQWKWWKRVTAFLAMLAVYVLGKKFLLGQLHLPVAAFSMGNATNLGGLFQFGLMAQNLNWLFSPALNHAVFANAGTLLAGLVLGWRKRFLPYMAVMIAFLLGQFLYGSLDEFRIFMQILPLSLMLLSERWREYADADAASDLSGRAGAAVWAGRETFPILLPLTAMVIGLSTGIAGYRYCTIFEDLRPGPKQSELGKHVVRPEGDVNNPDVEAQLLRVECAEAELELARIAANDRRSSDAIIYYQRALKLETNSVTALSGLAWLRATAADPGLRRGNEAVRLAERACQLTQYKEASLLGILAAAYAEAGRFADAVAAARKARAVALAQGQTVVAVRTEQLLKLYQSGRAYHQEDKSAP